MVWESKAELPTPPSLACLAAIASVCLCSVIPQGGGGEAADRCAAGPGGIRADSPLSTANTNGGCFGKLSHGEHCLVCRKPEQPCIVPKGESNEGGPPAPLLPRPCSWEGERQCAASRQLDNPSAVAPTKLAAQCKSTAHSNQRPGLLKSILSQGTQCMILGPSLSMNLS